MEALVLAGGRTSKLPVSKKADLPIGDRTMVDYVVAALEQVPAVQKVTVARDDADSLVENLLDALQRLSLDPEDRLLIASCDIPFLTPEAVLDFLARCEPGLDVYYPIVRKECCEQRFPGVQRTYARLREGTFTGGNLFLVRAGALPPLADRLQRLFQNRKSPLKLSRELGYGVTAQVVLSALLGTLSVTSLERRVAQSIGIRAKAVVSDYAEIGTDIDKESDLELLRQFFAPCLP
ncbi:MAG: NTP transferase domain-containing protein [Tumebacillaceae bacterium]